MSTSDQASTGPWPELDLAEWAGTLEALHLFTQVVGKVRLALAPFVNHWWQVPLYLSARGLTTSLIPVGARGLEIEFDVLDDRLVLRTTDGQVRHVELRPQSVAEFYAATMAALAAMEVSVTVVPRPVEILHEVAFPEDGAPRPYDAAAVRRFWQALLQARRVMGLFRARFVGKVSPVHFFWGAADLAVTRFSGRRAPMHPGGVPNCPDRVQVLAYSHEVSSCGYWPGGSEEGTFYAYAYPVPGGFAEWPVRPAAAAYDAGLGEFVLPYRAVRTARDPDATLLEFFQSTYEAAATLAGWDRSALELGPGIP